MNSAPVHLRASCRPDPALAPFIDRFWFCSVPEGGFLPPLLPGTGAECFFQLAQPFSIDGTAVPPASLLCNRTHTWQPTSDGPARLLAVRFRAGQLRHFAPASFRELQDRITPASDLWPNAETLHDQLIHAPDFLTQAQLLAGFFRQQLHEQRNATLDALIDRLYYAPNTRIEALAKTAGWSRSNLDKRFAALYGISPKHFARITRLQQVARRMALDPHERLLDQALDAGYFDQAHFSHDLRSLTGLAPRDLRAALAGRPHFYDPPSGKHRTLTAP